MAKNGATRALQNTEKMAGNGATLPNSETMVRNSHGEETDAPASRSNDVIQKTVSINSNDGIHGEKSLHGGATYKQNEVYTSAESSQSTPLQNASCNKEKQKVPTREEACKPLSKTFESNSMQDTSSDDNNVSSSCTKVKVKEEVQEFPCFSQLPWTHDVQKKVLDADVYPFDSNPKGIKAREEDLNQFLLNELEMELGGIPTMEDLDEDPIVSTSGWMEEDPDCSEGERITPMFGTLGRAALRGLTGARPINMLAAPQAPPAQVFTKIFSNIPTLPKIAEYAMISTGTTICAVEAHMFFNRNKKTIETEDKSTSADAPASKAPTYPWIGVGPGYQQGW
uniref:Uncharacterized protein n=1 Tax=Branchiostoma floridae TaxID=7739 RepID=C3Z1U1_BRAFL|eukprot:XP_002597446.1 hypothetical protein BRAFLDRAFT_122623 [Branchiostoma floridae]